MYRLLIIDDEPVIVNGLAHIFQGNSDFELDICRAYSSSEALEVAKRTKLDIIISDIRMPKKNGLELIDEIVYYWPLCRIILLTGYSEFSYIHEALRKNVDNYILKTEGIEPIFEAVQSSIVKLEEVNRQRLQYEKERMLLEIVEPILKKELMELILKGESISSLITRERYADVDFRIATDRPSLFLIGQADAIVETKRDKGKVFQSIQRIFNDLLPTSMVSEQVIYEDQVLVWLLQPGEDLIHRFQGNTPDAELNWQGIVIYLKGILELVQTKCEELLGVCVSFGISGNLLHQWDSIHLQVEAVRAMITKRMAIEPNMVILDLEKFIELQKESSMGVGNQQDEYKGTVIDQIHQYIHDNISGDVSLTSIADQVHFNPSYLSRYYKQMSGRNLIEYIQSTKLQVAIDLMENTTMKLNEIAVRAGFDSPSYFTTFFKKKTGQSPLDYRNSK